MTLYDIKPQFQTLLRPIVARLASKGVTANQVTLTAACGSLLTGFVLSLMADKTILFLLLPVWMFIRMALNAIDGMLAREFNQQSDLGAYLNEVCDVVADAALFIPFAFVLPFDALSIFLLIFLATLSEFVGVLGQSIGASRRYDGPLGKSDRALVFGTLALFLAVAGTIPAWLYWLMPLLSVLLALTVVNRIRCALAEKQQNNKA